jgi:DNA-binding MarR family transcriptional regulator
MFSGMVVGVNGVELFLLGRTLMRIGERAMPEVGRRGARVVLVVLSDVVEHPDSAIGEIAERTGLPQSQVSAAVARLREGGAVETHTDPADRRRALVRQAREVSARVAEVRETTIEAALAAALADTRRVPEVTALLEALSAHLDPRRTRD